MPNFSQPWSARFLDTGGVGRHAEAGLYNAKGDGTTDDSTAFVNWLSDIPAGGVGYLRSGATYIIDNVDLGAIAKDGVTIIGWGATIKKKTTGTFGFTNAEHMFRDTAGAWTNGTWIGITFDASRDSATIGDTVSAFLFSRTNGATFLNCTFKDGIEEGVKAYKCTDFVFDGCHFENIRNNGVQCLALTADSHTGTVADRGWARFRAVNCSFKTIDDGNNGTMEGQGISFGTTQAIACEDAQVTGCYFEDCIRGIWVENNVAGAPTRNVTITGNIVRDSISYGIGVIGCHGAVVTGNECYNIGTAASASSETAAYVFSGVAANKNRDVEAHGNIAIDDRGGSAEMDYGFRVLQTEDSTIIGGRVRGAVLASLIVDATVTSSDVRIRNPDVKFRGERSSVQSIPNATITTVDWNNVVSDAHGLWDGGNLRIGEDLLPGNYEVTAGISFASNATGRRMVRITADDGVTERVLAEHIDDACSSDDWSATVTAKIQKAHGEWIEVQVFQNSTVALDLRGVPSVFAEVRLVEGS